MRTILEIYPLKLEKVIEAPDGLEPVVEEVARGEGVPKPLEKTVAEAAQAVHSSDV